MKERERIAPAASSPRIERMRRILFLLIGVMLPLFAFPPVRLAGRPVDAATLVAALFLLASLPSLRRLDRWSILFLALAAAIPLLRLVTGLPRWFDLGTFAASYLHWVFMAAVFASASVLTLDAKQTERLLAAQAAAGAAVAAFAVYQVVGVPRGWAGTGTVLLPFQREPLRLNDMGGGYVRPTSLFLEPAWMGGYLAWVAGAALAVAARSAKRWLAAGAAAAAALCLLAVGASVSWGAYADAAAVLAALVVAAALARRSNGGRRGAALVGASALAVGLLLALTPPGQNVLRAASARLTALGTTPIAPESMTRDVRDSSWVRNRNLQHTVRLWRAHPARGVGLGHFAAFAGDDLKSGVRFGDAWCGWIASGAEMGIGGPLLLLAAFGLVVRRFRAVRPAGAAGLAVPPLLAFAFCAQIHTGSYIDLWFWYPLALAMACAGSRPVSPA